MKILKFLPLLIIISLLSVSCQHEFIKPVKLDPNKTVSFSETIEPIFENSCVSCHATGATSPDLSTGTAYASLSNNNLFDTVDPESSKLYTTTLLSVDFHNWKKMTSEESEYVLMWIKQGAQDN